MLLLRERWEKKRGAGRKASGKKGTVRGWPDTRALFDPEKNHDRKCKKGHFVTQNHRKMHNFRAKMYEKV